MRISDWSSDVCSSDLRGNRELIAGMVRDPQFGATVMFGVGGVLAEAIDDVVFRPAPLDAVTAEEMIDSLRSEERRVGKGCVSTCRSRCAPYHAKKKKRTRILTLQTRIETTLIL